MAIHPADRASTSSEADEREIEQTPAGVPQNGAQSSDHPNLVALEKETRRRLEIESTLQDSEARYRLLYDNNPTMYFTLSADGTVVSVNQFGATQLGYQPDELIGQSVLKVFKPEEHAAVLRQLEVCTASPLKVFQWEIQKMRKDGSTLWVKERAQAVMDHTGQILSLVVCEDITERRLTEDYMRESEERWRALFEHAGVGMAQLSLNEQFLRVNPRLCETLGYSSKTMLRRRCQDFVHPDDLSVTQGHLNELLAGKCPSFSMETRWHRSDDAWLWVGTDRSRSSATPPARRRISLQSFKASTIGSRAEAAWLQTSETRLRQSGPEINSDGRLDLDPRSGRPGIRPLCDCSEDEPATASMRTANVLTCPKTKPKMAHILATWAAWRDHGLPFAALVQETASDGLVSLVWAEDFPWTGMCPPES